MQTVALLASRARFSAGSRIAIRIAMIPITTSNSTSVNALFTILMVRSPSASSCQQTGQCNRQDCHARFGREGEIVDCEIGRGVHSEYAVVGGGEGERQLAGGTEGR